MHWQAFSVDDPVVVDGIAERRNQLSRQPSRGSKPETIAANISNLIVVMAALPLPDLFITDRYLCAAHLMGAEAAIVWNKADLAALPEAELASYAAIGYRLFPVSAVTGSGLEALLTWASNGIALLAGQSGVGKSSLLNRLVPGSDTATGQLSAASDEGRHTTTASIMYRLENGGRLIDTPGVRDFIPAIPDRRDIAHAERLAGEVLGHVDEHAAEGGDRRAAAAELVAVEGITDLEAQGVAGAQPGGLHAAGGGDDVPECGGLVDVGVQQSGIA